MGLHAAGHAKGRGLALVPPVLFQPSSRLWLQGYVLVTSLEPRKAENPPAVALGTRWQMAALSRPHTSVCPSLSPHKLLR